jgi:small subunit ribosomal protein S18
MRKRLDGINVQEESGGLGRRSGRGVVPSARRSSHKMKFEQRLGRKPLPSIVTILERFPTSRASASRSRPFLFVMSLKQLPLRIKGSLRVQTVRSFSSTAPHGSATIILDTLHRGIKEHAVSEYAKRQTLDLSRKNAQQSIEQERRIVERDEFARQIHRKWRAGDIYAPHDLTGREHAKWKKGKRSQNGDVVDALGINPLLEYKNFTIMSEFMTEMGRIKHSSLTGLRPVNQRKMAKAIRRAIGLGLMPSVHRHPLALKNHHPSRFS